MDAMARESNWEINRGGVALMWRGGCIIRSAFLGKNQRGVRPGSRSSPTSCSTRTSTSEMERCQDGWRRAAAAAITHGIPAPAMTSALAYFDGYRCDRLPANLLQAQRDYFGAHTYERVDRPRGQFFHTNWTGRGGSTSSSTYNV